MALTDFVFPVFWSVDGTLADVVPPAARLVFWGVLSGVIAMLVYWVFSPQKRIAATNAEVRRLRAEMRTAADDFARSMALSRRQLMLSLKVLGLAFGPTFVAGLPVLFIIFWVSAAYDLASPAAGTPVPLVVEPAEATLTVDGAAARSLPWPSSGAPVRLGDGTREIFAGPLSAAGFGVIHKHRWWNVVLGNDLGYLDPASGIESVVFQLEPRRVLPELPSWASTWEFPFFLSLVIVSLAIKFGFRIH